MPTPLQSNSASLDAASLGVAFTTANVSAGSKIIALVNTSNAGGLPTISSVTATGGNTLVKVGGDAAGTVSRTAIYACDAEGTGGTTMVGTKPTITVNLSAAGGLSFVVQEVPGCLPGNTTAMVDGTAGTLTGTAATTGSPTYSDTVSLQYKVAVYGDAGNGVSVGVPASGWTADAKNINASAISNCLVQYRNSTGGTDADGYTTADTGGWSIVEVAFKLAGGASPVFAARPGTTWMRRFKHRQVLPQVATAVAATVTGPPVYPMGHPVQARQLPQRGGSTSTRRGPYGQTGPAVRQWVIPVRGQPQVPFLKGRAVSRTGIFQGTGSVFRAAYRPVRGQPAVPFLKGRGTARTGTLGVTGPAVRVWNSPVQARRLPQRGGSVVSRTGPLGVTGPAVRIWHSPVQARPQYPVHGGTVIARDGTFTASAPAVRVLHSPVQARQLPQRAGHASRTAGVFQGTGPVFRAAYSPVRAQAAARPGGSVNRRYGTYTQVIIGAGPPVYPLGHPVQARQLPRRGGSASNRNGLFAGTGPSARQWNSPFRAAQPLPPHGRIYSRAGTYTGVFTGFGPPVYPLGHPVQARRLPQRGGSVTRRTGSYAGTGPAVRQLASPVRSAQPLPMRGRVVKAAGTYAGTGPRVRQWNTPFGVGRQQPPPPTRGRTAFQRGPAGTTGPPVVALRRPVQARRLPFRGGSTADRSGVFVPPPPFLKGHVTTSVTGSVNAGSVTGKVMSPPGIYPETYGDVYEQQEGFISGSKGSSSVTDPRDGTVKVTGAATSTEVS